MTTEPSASWPLATLVLGMAAWIVLVRGRRGALVSPMSVALLLLVSIYGVRPLYMISDDSYRLYGLDVRQGFNASAVAGFLAVIALVAGYGVASARLGRGEDEPASEGEARTRYGELSFGKVAVIAFGLVALSLLVSFARGGAGSIGELFEGRNPNNTSVRGLPVAVTTLPGSAAILIAVARVMVERTRKLRPVEHLLFWGVIVFSVIPPLALGNRRFLLPCVIAALIAILCPKYDKALPVRYAVGAVAGFVFLAIVPFIRSSGSRGGDGSFTGALSFYFSENGIAGSIKPFFTSYDTEMFSYVAYLAPRLGTSLEYGLGRGTVGDALLSPFPSALQPAELWSNQLLSSAFGGGCSAGICPVPSVVGVLYYDLGPAGVVVGCFALGYLLAQFKRAFMGSDGYRLIFVLGVASFAAVMVRGNTVNLAYIAVTTCVISCLAFRLARPAVREADQHAHPGARRQI